MAVANALSSALCMKTERDLNISKSPSSSEVPAVLRSLTGGPSALLPEFSESWLRSPAPERWAWARAGALSQALKRPWSPCSGAWE